MLVLQDVFWNNVVSNNKEEMEKQFSLVRRTYEILGARARRLKDKDFENHSFFWLGRIAEHIECMAYFMRYVSRKED